MSVSSPLSSMILRGFLVALLLGGVVIVIANYTAMDSATVDVWVKEAGAVGPIVFIVVYAIGTVLLVPGPLFMLVSGALYGPVYGTFYSLTGVMIGAAIAFLIARFIAADWLEAKIGGRLKRLKEGVEQEGWRFVAFLRLVPVFPSILINYALGLTRIKFSHYFFTSYICKLPAVAAYVYVGHAGLEAISGTENIIPTVLIGMTLIGIALFIPRLIINLRRDPPMDVAELKAQLQAGEKILLLDVRTAEELSGDQICIVDEMKVSIDDLEQRLDELADYIEQPIALFSPSEKLSSIAAEILVSNGFAHVHIVRGSIGELEQTGLPIRRSQSLNK
jgi:uncharacterized membrane protein YdjX (TVP38/TMEM64 family)/rhodanese-related sulfurtransferase